MEAVAARKVMHPRPGRHGGGARAVVVAAAVVQIPAQVRVGQPLAVEPVIKNKCIQCLLVRWQRPVFFKKTRRNLIARTALGLGHQRGKAAVLGQGVGGDAVGGQQACLPVAIEIQPLLRAVAQVTLVIHPAARHALAHTQVFQQMLQVGVVVAGHGQVVRPHRAGQATQRGGAGIAPGFVFQLQQGVVVMPGQVQSAGSGQPGHAASGNQGVDAAEGVGRSTGSGAGVGNRAAGGGIAQGMTALRLLAHKAAADVIQALGQHRLAARQRQGTTGRCGGATQHELAAGPCHACSS